jgi:hypothetical protein
MMLKSFHVLSPLKSKVLECFLKGIRMKIWKPCWNEFPMRIHKTKYMHYINTRHKTWNITFQLFENEKLFNLFKINALKHID